MKTPIFIKLDSFIDLQKPWVEEPKTAIDLSLLEYPLTSNDRFYFRFFSPKTVNDHNAQDLYSSVKYDIPVHPEFNKVLRLKLEPTIGFGRNSCYFVELWKWNKVFNNTLVNFNPKIVPVKVSASYWMIPNIDRVFFNSYTKANSYCYQFKFLEELKIEDGLTTHLFDPIKDEIISIHKILDEEGNEYIEGQDFKLLDDSNIWKLPPPEAIEDTPDLPALSPIYQLEWITPVPPIYTIHYIKPINKKDINYLLGEHDVFPPCSLYSASNFLPL